MLAMSEDHPLKSYREKHGMTRADLARELDVSKTTVGRWEEGHRKIDETMLPLVVSKTSIPARKLRPDLAELLRGGQ